MHRIVVVGAGLAGHRAATALRERGFAGEVVVVGDEKHLPYDRPPLSKQLLAGTFTVDQCHFATDDLDVTWQLGSAAMHLDPQSAKLTLATGAVLEYDGLVIATGRRARLWPGSTPEGVHTLRTLDDALRFREAAAKGANVVIIGAGFVGCEVASTLRQLGVENVTVVDSAAHPMPVLGAAIGRRATELHTAHGVQLRLASGVASINGADRVESVTLIDGEVLPANLVLVSVGSEPNSEWLHGSGIRLANGAVVCDPYSHAVGLDGTTLENVTAVGDIAAWPDPFGSGPTCIEHWSNARDMAALAVTNLLSAADDRQRLALVPTFWSDQHHVKIKSAGFLRVADRIEIVSEDVEKPSLVAEAYRGDVLVGAVVFNMNRTIIDYQRRLADVAGLADAAVS